MVQLINHHDLPGGYELLPQVYEDCLTVLLSSPSPSGIIPPHSTTHISLALEHRSTVYISTFRTQDPPIVCLLRSIEEAVIYIYPTQDDFSNIYVAA